MLILLGGWSRLFRRLPEILLVCQQSPPDVGIAAGAGAL